MKSEDEPVSSDEWLLRMVWRDRLKSDTNLVSKSAFEPRPDDTTGISLFRESCCDSPLRPLDCMNETKRDSYGIVKISVEFLASLELDVVKDPKQCAPGHVVVPKINITAYKNLKKELNLLFNQLSRQASENIVRKPIG